MTDAMRARLRGCAAVSACALALVATSVAAPAAMPGAPVVPESTPAPPAGCVAALRGAGSGGGSKGYVSRYVTVDAYAYGEWRTGAFGGQSLWHKRGAAWCKVQTGIVTLDRGAMVRFGVPAATASTLLAKMHAAGDLAPPTAAPGLLSTPPERAHAPAAKRHR
ncbi:MAG: hypothetical protein NVS1B2_18650 [Vulcanimicrobiaceae bacterium]